MRTEDSETRAGELEAAGDAGSMEEYPFAPHAVSYHSSRLVWVHWFREHGKRSFPLWLLSFLIFASGFSGIVQTLATRFTVNPHSLGILLPFELIHLSRSSTVVLGFLLIYLSFRVLQRWRVAWWAAVAGCTLSVASHLGQLQYWYAVPAPATTVFFLLILRRRFTVRTDRQSMAQGLRLVGIIAAVAVVYGTVGFLLLDRRDFGVSFSLTEALESALRELILLGSRDLPSPATVYARWFADSLRIMGITAGALAAFSLFRPIARTLVTLPFERETARRLLDRYGRSSYGYFKVWSDKSYYFMDGREAFVSYGAAYGVALALGDPVGPPDVLVRCTESFLSHCEENGWLAAFLFPDSIPMYLGLGLSIVKVGEDAIIDLDRFCSVTVNRKYFRYVRRKFEGEGYTLSRSTPPHTALLLREVREVSASWLSQPGYREFGFVQGRMERGYIDETHLYLLRDPEGALVAFLSEVPSYRHGEANFDMMRHRPGVHWGTMDYLFQGLMRQLQSDGYRTFNMGLAPFSGVGEGHDATLVEKSLHLISEHLNGIVHSRGLKRYKLKFEPMWEERYLVYQGRPLSLAQIALAISKLL